MVSVILDVPVGNLFQTEKTNSDFHGVVVNRARNLHMIWLNSSILLPKGCLFSTVIKYLDIVFICIHIDFFFSKLKASPNIAHINFHGTTIYRYD